MENSTAKHFVLQLGSLIGLYLSSAFLLVLIFGVINVLFPDASDYVWEIEGAQSQIRLGIAMVLVFFPAYLILTRTVNNLRRKESAAKYLGLTRWLIYVSLLVAGLTLLIDLVVVIMSFLEGDITVRFILKAVAVLVVIGAAFYYYLKDARSYWLEHEATSKLYAGIASIVVLLAVVLGFLNIDTPEKVREMKIDQQIVGDLQDMQWRIEDHYRSNEALPESLAAAYGTFSAPTAPEGKSDYVYEIESDTDYTLCAEFNHDSAGLDRAGALRPTTEKNYDWRYQAGEWCFEREIDGEYRP